MAQQKYLVSLVLLGKSSPLLRKLNRSSTLKHPRIEELRATKVGVSHQFCSSSDLEKALQHHKMEVLSMENWSLFKKWSLGPIFSWIFGPSSWKIGPRDQNSMENWSRDQNSMENWSRDQNSMENWSWDQNSMENWSWDQNSMENWSRCHSHT